MHRYLNKQSDLCPSAWRAANREDTGLDHRLFLKFFQFGNRLLNHANNKQHVSEEDLMIIFTQQGYLGTLVHSDMMIAVLGLQVALILLAERPYLDINIMFMCILFGNS